MSTPYSLRTQSDPEVYIRRRPLFERVLVVAAMVVAVVVLTVQMSLDHRGRVDLSWLTSPRLVVYVLLVLVLAAVFLLKPLRTRLLADADGLHVRGAVRTRHLPWPASRQELVIEDSFVGRYRATVVRYRPLDGSPQVTIGALTCGSKAEVYRRSQVRQEVADLWEWGRARGYVPGGSVRDTQRPGHTAVEYEYPAQAGYTDQAGYGTTGHTVQDTNSPAHGYWPQTAALDPALRAQDHLVFRPDRARTRNEVLIFAVVAVILTVAAALSLTRPDLDTTERVASWIVLMLGAMLWLPVLFKIRQRTVVDRDGLHDLGAHSHAVWPTSRSNMFVHILYAEPTDARHGVVATPVVVDDDGRFTMLSDLGESGTDPEIPLRVSERLDQLWAWGLAHGATKEHGVYHPCSAQEIEDQRVESAGYLAELARRRMPR